MLKEKEGKARIVINYKKLNNNTVFYGYYIPNKTVLFNRIQGPLCSQKYIVNADIDK